jgi:uracil-DNA glycosylase
MQEINLKEIQLKLYEKLKPSGWADKLKGFLLTDDFLNILITLYNNTKSGKRFTPQIKYLLRAFEECNYNELKVVFIGQDPYSYPEAADGICFSCSLTKKEQTSLTYIFDEIQRTVYPDQLYSRDKDLKRWSNQGILMLNSALTTEMHKPGTHMELWKPFMLYLLDILKSYNPGLIYVFTGNHASQYANQVSDKHNYKFFTTHPAFASYKKQQMWDSDDVFNKINKILKENNNQKITW